MSTHDSVFADGHGNVTVGDSGRTLERLARLEVQMNAALKYLEIMLADVITLMEWEARDQPNVKEAMAVQINRRREYQGDLDDMRFEDYSDEKQAALDEHYDQRFG